MFVEGVTISYQSQQTLTGAKIDSSLSPSFLNCFFCFFGCSGMGVGLQKLAFLSHTEMVINPLDSSASWRFSCEG